MPSYLGQPQNQLLYSLLSMNSIMPNTEPKADTSALKYLP